MHKRRDAMHKRRDAMHKRRDAMHGVSTDTDAKRREASRLYKTNIEPGEPFITSRRSSKQAVNQQTTQSYKW